jgi:uncharacterized protein
MTSTKEQLRQRLAAAAASIEGPSGLPTGCEQRFFSTSIRSERSAGKKYAVGHAATFGTLSSDLGGFRERIRKGAFARAIRERQDTKFLLNHNPSLIIARVKNGTLELAEDSVGLVFRALLPSTTAGRDLEQQLDDNLIDECSFAFTCSDGQSWSRERDPETGQLCDVRALECVDDLLDCSAVTYPAYPGTDAALAARALWPTGLPAEIRSRIHLSADEEIARIRARIAAAKRTL